MKHKLKHWQKYLISYTCFFLIIALAAVSFVLLSRTSAASYGIMSGQILHSTDGTDITDDVLNSETPTVLLENEKLKFSVSSTGNITVENKESGSVWSSEISEDAESHFTDGYQETHSLFNISYLNEKNALTQWTAYEQCINKKQIRVLKKDTNTVRLDFILGESATDQVIPTGIVKKRFEKEILPKLDKEDQEFLKRQYVLYEADKLTAEDYPDTLYEMYPNLKTTPIYIAKNISGKVLKKKLTAVFEKIGYTAEDLQKDNDATGYADDSSATTYKLAVDFSLLGSDLTVCIPKDEILFYTERPMLKLSLMPFFTSSVAKASVLVPSGSGAVIEYTGAGNAASFSGTVYGGDLTSDNRSLPEVMDGDSQLTFPMYAVRRGSDTVTAIIESGAATAELKYKSNGGSMNSYFDFTVLQYDNYYRSETNVILRCGKTAIAEDICLRYRFGTCEEAESDDTVFSSVARDYKALLKKSGALPIGEDTGEDPVLLLNMIGSVSSKKELLGLFKTESCVTLTDFNGAAKMLEYFTGKQLKNISVSLSGFNKGGLLRQIPGKTALNGDLGSINSLESLLSGGIKCYSQANHTLYLNPSGALKAKSGLMAEFVSGNMAAVGTYSPVEGNNGAEGTLAIVSPAYYEKAAATYIKSGLTHLSVTDLARILNSDYSDNYYDRNRTENMVVQVLKAYSENGIELSADDANLYALPYIGLIENMPITHSGNAAFTKAFPLKQIILHGSINYTVKTDFSIAETKNRVLNVIRFGGGLNASLVYENSDYSFPSYFSWLYAFDFEICKEKIAEYGNTVYTALKGLGKEEITAYESSGNVSATKYSNGTVIYVNTGDAPAEYKGVKIPAQSYVRTD